MADFVKVAVTETSGKVSCAPDTVELYPTKPGAPTEVEWTLDDAPEGSKLVIKWENEVSPFEATKTSADGRTVYGLGNTGEIGEYPYTAMVTSDDGTVTRVDPRIVNRPWPP